MSNIEQNFKRLKQEQEAYLQSCNDRIANWEKYKNDYIQLRKRIETLPNELNYDIMVPISKVAFMPGKLIHTNEILVLLGDNWFVDRSAQQACQIIDRRLVGVQNFMDDLIKEKTTLLDQIEISDNLYQEQGEYVNIEEKLDDVQPKAAAAVRKQLTEDEKKEIRRKQQERALKTQAEIDKKLEQENKMSCGISITQDSDDEDDDDDNSNKISNKENSKPQFEKQKIKQLVSKDQPNLKFEDMLKEYEQSLNRENNSYVQEILEKNVPTNFKISNESKKVKWLDDNQVASENRDDDDDNEETDDDYDQYDTSESDHENVIPTNIIKIKHFKNEHLDELQKNRNLSRDKPALDTPGDIFNVFYKPKSILKQRSHHQEEAENKSLIESTKAININSNDSSNKEETENTFKFEPKKAFSGEIVERQCEETASKILNASENKPVSKFKASKMNK